jgi:hypothetical protein
MAGLVETGSTKEKTYPLLSRGDIQALIADGRKIFIVDNHVLKVDGWVRYHPGGHLAIMHMVGRDATDEVNAWVHPSSTSQTQLPQANRSSQSALPRSSTADEAVSNWADRRTMEELRTADPRRHIPVTRTLV